MESLKMQKNCNKIIMEQKKFFTIINYHLIYATGRFYFLLIG